MHISSDFFPSISCGFHLKHRKLLQRHSGSLTRSAVWFPCGLLSFAEAGRRPGLDLGLQVYTTVWRNVKPCMWISAMLLGQQRWSWANGLKHEISGGVNKEHASGWLVRKWSSSSVKFSDLQRAAYVALCWQPPAETGEVGCGCCSKIGSKDRGPFTRSVSFSTHCLQSGSSRSEDLGFSPFWRIEWQSGDAGRCC